MAHLITCYAATLSEQNIMNTFLIHRGMDSKEDVESVTQRSWPMLTPILPTVVSSWLDVVWVLNHS